MSDKSKDYENEDTIIQLQNGAGKDITVYPSIDPDFEDLEVEDKTSNKEYAEKNLKEIIEIGTSALRSLAQHTNVEGVSLNDESLEIIYSESPKLHNSISTLIRSLTTANHKLTTLGIESGKVDGGDEDDEDTITLSLSIDDIQRKLKKDKENEDS